MSWKLIEAEALDVNSSNNTDGHNLNDSNNSNQNTRWRRNERRHNGNRQNRRGPRNGIFVPDTPESRQYNANAAVQLL